MRPSHSTHVPPPRRRPLACPHAPGSPSQERLGGEGTEGGTELRRTKEHTRLPGTRCQSGPWGPPHTGLPCPKFTLDCVSSPNKQLPGPCPCPGAQNQRTLWPLGLGLIRGHSGLRSEPEAQLQVGPPAQPCWGPERPQERKAASPQGGECFSRRPVSAQSPPAPHTGPRSRPQGKHLLGLSVKCKFWTNAHESVHLNDFCV